MIKLINITTDVQTHLVGQATTSAGTDLCDGGDRDDCAIGANYLPMVWDGAGDRWWYAEKGDNHFWSIDMSSATGAVQIENTTDTTRVIQAFTYVSHGGKDYMYYCGYINGDNFEMRRFNLTSDTDELLTWPIAHVRCAEGNMLWSASRGTVLFNYKNKNTGLFGIAEYLIQAAP